MSNYSTYGKKPRLEEGKKALELREEGLSWNVIRIRVRCPAEKAWDYFLSLSPEKQKELAYLFPRKTKKRRII